jgi:hypothetical protein
MDDMKRKVPELAEIVMANGTLSWNELNEANIPTSDTSIDRSKLNHIRHWSEIVSHESVVARFHQEKASRDPVNIARIKAEADARALILKSQLDELRSNEEAEQKRIKDEARALETARVKALTPQEKRNEKNVRTTTKAAKDLVLLEKKRTLHEDKAHKLLLAKNLIGGLDIVAPNPTGAAAALFGETNNDDDLGGESEGEGSVEDSEEV